MCSRACTRSTLTLLLCASLAHGAHISKPKALPRAAHNVPVARKNIFLEISHKVLSAMRRYPGERRFSRSPRVAPTTRGNVGTHASLVAPPGVARSAIALAPAVFRSTARTRLPLQLASQVDTGDASQAAQRPEGVAGAERAAGLRLVYDTCSGCCGHFVLRGLYATAAPCCEGPWQRDLWFAGFLSPNYIVYYDPCNRSRWAFSLSPDCCCCGCWGYSVWYQAPGQPWRYYACAYRH